MNSDNQEKEAQAKREAFNKLWLRIIKISEQAASAS